jgi:hypothetical protein
MAFLRIFQLSCTYLSDHHEHDLNDKMQMMAFVCSPVETKALKTIRMVKLNWLNLQKKFQMNIDGAVNKLPMLLKRTCRQSAPTPLINHQFR